MHLYLIFFNTSKLAVKLVPSALHQYHYHRDTERIS